MSVLDHNSEMGWISTPEMASGERWTYQADGGPVERVLLDPVPAAALTLLIPVWDDVSPRQQSIQFRWGGTRRLAMGIGGRGAGWWLYGLWTRVVGVEEGTEERRRCSGTKERGASNGARGCGDGGDERYASGGRECAVRATDGATRNGWQDTTDAFHALWWWSHCEGNTDEARVLTHSRRCARRGDAVDGYQARDAL